MIEQAERLMRELGITASVEEQGIQADGRTRVYKVTLTRNKATMSMLMVRCADGGRVPSVPTGARAMQDLCWWARIYYLTRNIHGFAEFIGGHPDNPETQGDYRKTKRRTKDLEKLLGSEFNFERMCAAALG